MTATSPQLTRPVLITACLVIISYVPPITESLVLKEAESIVGVELNEKVSPGLFKANLTLESNEQNKSPQDDLTPEKSTSHPNASGWIIPRQFTNHPNASGWIIPRGVNHPNATGEIIPRGQVRHEDLSKRSVPDFISGDSWNRKPNPFSRQTSQYLGCGSYTVAPGAVFKIRTKNYPSAYPKNYKCTWMFTGTTEAMVMNVDCSDVQLPLCNKGTASAKKRCTQNNFLLISDNSQKQSYNGARGPVNFSTEGNFLSLTLRTQLVAKGFSCSIQAVPTESTTAGSTEAIASGNSSTCDCGVGPSPAGRIVGGVNSAAGRWPWVGGLVQLEYSKVFCGATLIHPLWAVTAAHCFESATEGPLTEILLGAYDLNHPSTSQQRIRISSVHIHEGYDDATENNDIAILRLSTAALITDNVGLACLPEENEPYEGITASAAGWGRLKEGGESSVILQEVQLKMITKVECAEVYGQDLSPTMICAYEDSKDTCQGDSGGGLMWPNSAGKWVLGGIVSWGSGCARPGIPGVYTETSKYLSWISKITGISQCPGSSQLATTTTITTRPFTNTTTPGPSKSCKCGLTYKRIVGGVETGVNEYPWQVGLVVVGSKTPFCGASIVGRRYILTAAHCTQAMTDYGWKAEALVGAHSTSPNTNTPYFARIPIESISQHSQYDDDSMRHDISLIKLASALDLDADPRLAPVCLPTPPAKTYTGFNAVVSGWGRLTEGGTQPQTLQKVWVPVISNAACEESYPGGIFGDSLCAGYAQGGKDSCQGDSGGPLVTEDNAVMVQIGVVSWGSGCARPDKPGVYARVSEYLPWIQSIKGSLDTCA